MRLPLRLRLLPALLVAVVAPSSPALAQQDEPLPRPPVVFGEGPPPTFKTTRTVVTVDAVVTDAQGRHVTDLGPGDFEVLLKGKRQTLQQVVYVPVVSPNAPRQDAPAAASATASAEARAAARPALVPLGDALGARPARITRTIAVVVDDLGMSWESTVYARRALKTFVDEQVQPGDLVAILRTSGGIGALQQFTTDKRLLHAAVDRVRWTVASRSGVSAFTAVVPSNGIDPDPKDPTRADAGARVDDRELAEPGAAYTEDAEEVLRENVLATGSLGALEFVVRGVQNLPGRKAVVFISEGFDLFNRKGQAKVYAAFTRLMDRANRAGVVVYTMDGRGLEAGGLNAEDNPQTKRSMTEGDGNDGDRFLRELIIGHQARRQAIIQNTEEALHYLAWQTGGFAILNSNDMTGGFRRVLDDLRGYYLLGYDAPEDTPRAWDPGQVSVKVKREGLRVRSRQGFFGPADPNEKPEPLGDALTAAALSPFNASGITVRLTSLFGHDAAQGPYVRSLLFLDTNGLSFTESAEGRHEAKVEILQLAVGDNGAMLGNWRRELTLSLTGAQLADARTRGIVYSTRMPVKQPGAYQVRTAVRDVATEAVGSASQFLEVPRVGKGRLALSGVLVKAQGDPAAGPQPADGEVIDPDQARQVVAEVLGEPSVRIFEPGSDVVYAYEIYDGLGEKAADALEMSTTLLRDGRVLYESPWTPVKAAKRSGDLRVIPVAGQLSFGKDVPPGPYTIGVRVGPERQKAATQWIDVEVRR